MDSFARNVPNEIAYEICRYVSYETLFCVWWDVASFRKKLLKVVSKLFSITRVRVLYSMTGRPDFIDAFLDTLYEKNDWRRNFELSSVLKYALTQNNSDALSRLLLIDPTILYPITYLPVNISLQSATWLVRARAPVCRHSIMENIRQSKMSLKTLKVLIPYMNVISIDDVLRNCHRPDYLKFFFTEGRKYVNFRHAANSSVCLDMLPYVIVQLWIELSDLNYDRFTYDYLADQCDDVVFLNYLRTSPVKFIFSQNALRNAICDENMAILEWWYNFYREHNITIEPFTIYAPPFPPEEILQWMDARAIMYSINTF